MQKEGGGLRVPPTHPTIYKINIKVKGPSPISSSNVTTHPPHNQTIPKEESRRKRQKEARGCMAKYEEVLEEGRGPRVPRSKVCKVQCFQGPKDLPRYLKSHSNTNVIQECPDIQQPTSTSANTRKCFLDVIISYTVVAERVGYFVLLNYEHTFYFQWFNNYQIFFQPFHFYIVML